MTNNWTINSDGWFKLFTFGKIVFMVGKGLKSPSNIVSAYIAHNIPYKYRPKYDFLGSAINTTDQNNDYQITIVDHTIAITDIGWIHNCKADCAYDFNLWYILN